MPSMLGEKGGQGLVLYDGVCVLCSGWFRFVARRDIARRFRFTAIQSDYGRALALKLGIDPDDPLTNAVLLDGRFPTGDEQNLLGSGKFSGRGLGIVSAKFGTLAPHLNVGYVFRDAKQANNSVVAAAGFDNAVASWATMAFDLRSEWQLGDSKLHIPGPVQYLAPFPHTVDPTNIPDQKDDFLSASVGFKFQTPRGVLITTNALFPLRNSGMQPSVVWTAGFEYNF